MATYTDRFLLTAEDRTKAATAAAQANFKRLEAGAGQLKTALGALGGALLLRQAVRFTGDTLKMAQAIGDTAEKAGLTAEQLQVLRFAADQNGSSAQALDKAMIRLNVSLGEAGRVALGLEDRVSLAGEALTALGVDVLDASGKVRTSADLFPELIDALAAVESPAERAALAAQIFGKRIGPELAVLINQGSGPLEAYRQKLIETGALIDNDLVQGSRELADQIGRVGGAVRTNFERGFLQAFVGDFKDLEAAVADPALVQSINEIGRQFGTLFKEVVDGAPAALRWLKEIKTVTATIAAAKVLKDFGVPLPVGVAIGAGVNLINASTTPETKGAAGLSINDALKRTGQSDAEQAARTRAAIQATRDIAQATQQRLTVETDASQRLVALKQSETARLTAELAKQKTAYDQATAAVRAALRQREQIEQEFADLSKQPGAATSSQVSLQAFAAQRALQAGDPKEALRLAREAAAAMRELQSAGDTSATLQLTGRRIQQVARDAAQAQLQQAQQAQATAEQAIQNILNLAAQIKALPVGFDTATAITDAQTLRAALEAQLAANPIVVPVVLDTSAADQFAKTQIDKIVPPGRASGGYIPGRSPHPRADNILIRATAGEYVLPVGAVQRLTAAHGAGLLEQLRRGQLPGYADGGPVARQLLAGLDSGARPNLAAIAGNPTLPAIQGDTINLVMPDGKTHAVRADRDTSKALQRDMRMLAIKSGKR